MAHRPPIPGRQLLALEEVKRVGAPRIVDAARLGRALQRGQHVVGPIDRIVQFRPVSADRSSARAAEEHPAGPRTPRPHVGRRGAPADHRSARHRRSDRASAAASRTPTTSRRPACGGSSNRRRATASAAAVVDEPEPDDGGQCAALPGPAPPVATVDDRNAILTPDDCRIELVEVARRQPGRHHPLADRLEVRIAGRVADVGQRHEYPVRAPPLRVRPTPDRACPSSNRRTLGEDRLARWSLRIARESRSSSSGVARTFQRIDDSSLTSRRQDGRAREAARQGPTMTRRRRARAAARCIAISREQPAAPTFPSAVAEQ